MHHAGWKCCTPCCPKRHVNCVFDFLKQFDSARYLDQLYTKLPLPQLVSKEKALGQQIRQLDGDMQTLVYENYNKFISATDTIRKMKSQVDDMDDEMEKLSNNMNNISNLSEGISDALGVKRGRIRKLTESHLLLKKLQVLRLPIVISLSFEICNMYLRVHCSDRCLYYCKSKLISSCAYFFIVILSFLFSFLSSSFLDYLCFLIDCFVFHISFIGMSSKLSIDVVKFTFIFLTFAFPQFLFELPSRLKKCVERKAYEQAVRYYSRAANVLEMYKTLDSFKGINDECNAIMSEVTASVNELITADGASQDQIMRWVLANA